MGLAAKTSKSNLLRAESDVPSAIKHPAADLHLASKRSLSFLLAFREGNCKKQGRVSVQEARQVWGK